MPQMLVNPVRKNNLHHSRLVGLCLKNGLPLNVMIHKIIVLAEMRLKWNPWINAWLNLKIWVIFLGLPPGDVRIEVFGSISAAKGARGQCRCQECQPDPTKQSHPQGRIGWKGQPSRNQIGCNHVRSMCELYGLFITILILLDTTNKQ